jgi:uncharacterized protein YndB with AHSA1/START domain
METIKFQVQLKILKPVAEVFDGVVNPKKLSGYFVKTASGPMVAGQTVEWRFPEPEMAEIPVPVKVKEVVPNERIVFTWEGGEGFDTTVEMSFKSLGPSATMVQISESGWPMSEKSLQQSHGNAGGGGVAARVPRAGRGEPDRRGRELG